MIYVSHRVSVNDDTHAHIGRHTLWDGLVRKANNALPFVPALTFCEVTRRYDDHTFDRVIVFRGRRFTEQVRLEPRHRVLFTRLDGPVRGAITNEIEGDEADLGLRFSFALAIEGVRGGSPEEAQHAQSMTADYLAAINATLAAVRHLPAFERSAS
jgi:hypothetical protein